MSSSTSPHSVTRSPSSLPIELVSQILQGSRLSKPDLARCCLVNHRLLSITQRLLYSSITICDGPYGRGKSGKTLQSPERLLLETLRKNCTLCGYIEEMEVIRCYPLSERGLKKLLGKFIELAPGLDSLVLGCGVWGIEPVRALVFSEGKRWRTLNVGMDLLSVTREEKAKQWHELPNLRQVRCFNLSVTEDPTLALPSSIEILDLERDLPSTEPLPNPQLRVLRCRFSEKSLARLGSFQNLQHLTLSQRGELPASLQEATLATFSTLPVLRSLSIDIAPLRSRAILRDLLSHLPPSVERIDFLYAAPFKFLKRFISSSSTTFSIRSIGISSRFTSSECNQLRLETFSSACREEGIEVVSLW